MQRTLEHPTNVVKHILEGALTPTRVGGHLEPVAKSKQRLAKFSELTPFAQRLRLLCRREGKEPSPLSLAVPLSSDTVGKWLRLGRPGNVEQLTQLARHYRLSIDWLLAPEPIDEDFDLPKEPQTMGGISQPGESVARLTITPEVMLLLAEPLRSVGETMGDLPDKIRRAALGVTCVYGYPLESTARAGALLAVAYEQSGDLDRVTPEDIFNRIRNVILAEGKPPSGTYPSVNLVPKAK